MESTAKKSSATGKKSKRFRTIFLIFLLIFIVIQFFQPDKNNNDVTLKNDIRSLVPVPDTVEQLLKAGCYDCHSNNTKYPWYTNIQPVGWWMQNHIKEGKEHLNFNEFASITARNGKSARERQIKKLEDIKETIIEGEMPLNSYLWIHTNARFNKTQQKFITDWTDSAGHTLKTLPQQ
jgi:hypothetical protein